MPGRGRLRPTLLDAVFVAAAGALVATVALPQARVRGVLVREDEMLTELAELGRIEEAHRAAARTDRDGDGRGEYAPLGDALGALRSGFTRAGEDAWERGGWYFAALLPDRDRRPSGAAAGAPSPDFAEAAVLLVAWPSQPGRSGMRAYALWPGGIVLQHTIDGYPYGTAPPRPEAPLVVVEPEGVRAAPRCDADEWRPPVFNVARPPR